MGHRISTLQLGNWLENYMLLAHCNNQLQLKTNTANKAKKEAWMGKIRKQLIQKSRIIEYT